jgi:hypothetical protein
MSRAWAACGATRSDAPLDLLRRRVRRRSDERAGPHDVDGHVRTGDAEVGDGRAPVRDEKHVVRLQIAVNDADDVRGVEAAGDVDGDVDGETHRERTVAFDTRAERLAFEQFHREEPAPKVVADVERPGDVTVRHFARELHFIAELPERLGRGKVSRQHLERHELVETGIANAVDGAHSASAEERQDLIPGREESVVAKVRKRRVAAAAATLGRVFVCDRILELGTGGGRTTHM